MSLYSFLNKDTLVYNKFKHFINDPRFNTLINDYLNSDIDDFYALSANSNTRICLNKDKLVVSVNPLPQPINSYDHGYPSDYMPIAIITNPRSQGCPRFQSGEELANSVGKINAC